MAILCRVLAELAARPEAAPTLAALCVDLGKELGEYLLQQLDWVLQVNNNAAAGAVGADTMHPSVV